MLGHSIDQSAIVVHIFFSSLLPEVMQSRVARGRWIPLPRLESTIVDAAKPEEKFALKVHSVAKALAAPLGFTCGGNISLPKMLEVRDFDFTPHNRRGEEAMRESSGSQNDLAGRRNPTTEEMEVDGTSFQGRSPQPQLDASQEEGGQWETPQKTTSRWSPKAREKLAAAIDDLAKQGQTAQKVQAEQESLFWPRRSLFAEYGGRVRQRVEQEGNCSTHTINATPVTEEESKKKL